MRYRRQPSSELAPGIIASLREASGNSLSHRLCELLDILWRETLGRMLPETRSVRVPVKTCLIRPLDSWFTLNYNHPV